MQVQLGTTVNTLGLRSFTMPHNFMTHLGVHVFEPNKYGYDVQNLWRKIRVYLEVICPELIGSGHYSVTISKMDNMSYCRKHTDSRDIDKQLVVTFSVFDGGELRVYDQDCKHYVDLCPCYNPVMFDGRMPHEVLPIPSGI
jgi:hypothetical protein